MQNDFPPKMVLCVGAVVLKDDKVLFIRQSYGGLKGQWSIPWGYVDGKDPDGQLEPPDQAALRETKEEANITAELIGFLGAQNHSASDGDPRLYLLYLCQHLAGEPKPDYHETDRAGYFSLAEMDTFDEPIDQFCDWIARKVLQGNYQLIKPELDNPYRPARGLSVSMINEEFLPGIIIGLGVGLLLGLTAFYGYRRGRFGRLALVLLAPLFVLIPVSWPLAGALSYGGRMEQLRCAFVVVIPLSVTAWLLARIAGWDLEEKAEEKKMSLLDMQAARRRWANQNILESENLTADLPDQEAKVLLRWGLAQVDILVKQTAKLLADDAQALLEQQLTILRKLIRGITKLAADERPVEPERLSKRLGRLLAAANELDLSQPSAEQIDAYVNKHPQLTVTEKLEQLLALFGQTIEQAKTTPSDKEFS